MAIDSALKRKAVPGTARPSMRSQGNDATKTRPWRASVGNAYPVANFAAPGGPTYVPYPLGHDLSAGIDTMTGGLQT